MSDEYTRLDLRLLDVPAHLRGVAPEVWAQMDPPSVWERVVALVRRVREIAR